MPRSHQTTRRSRSRSRPTKKRLTKYESCVLQVKAKQSKQCLSTRQWGKKLGPNKQTCYNPWAVCDRVRKATKTAAGTKKTVGRTKIIGSYVRKATGERFKVYSQPGKKPFIRSGGRSHVVKNFQRK